jgi:DNA replication and repair protein RecF
MYLQKLRLENFRNFPGLSLDFKAQKGINIFIGPNAQGKTNILEAIYLLSFPRSFRTKKSPELILFDQNYYTIEGNFKTDNQQDLELKIGYQLDPLRRSYQKNQVQITLKEYLTNFQSVIFTPEDIEILTGTPSLRRRLIDTLLSQVNREYFQDIVALTKVLKQRNALLKRIREKLAQRAELEYWDRELVSLTAKITKFRQAYITFLEERMQKVYSDISSKEDNLVKLEYHYPSKHRYETGEYASYEEALFSQTQDDYHQEVISGHTHSGPHRDDFEFLLDGNPASRFCSRGEKRSLMLSLKIIELEFLEEQTGHRPVLLLDDVFSELDAERRHKLLELTKDYQTFISTVEEKYFEGFKKGDLNIFEMEKL